MYTLFLFYSTSEAFSNVKTSHNQVLNINFNTTDANESNEKKQRLFRYMR